MQENKPEIKSITFSSADTTTPEALLATFGGTIQNGVWYAPEIRQAVKDEDYWVLQELEPEGMVIRHYTGRIETFTITSEVYEYFKGKVAQRFKINAKVTLPTEITKSSTLDFEGVVFNPKQ